MNDYGFDYLNYITNVPSSMNYMKKNMTNMNMGMKNPSTNMSVGMKKTSQLIEPYQGFIRGNSFENEYDPYQNYQPMELNPSNEREALLYQLLQYKFVLTDLNLYLDTHPKDSEMLQLYNKYLGMVKQIADKYENMYGPLTVDSSQMDSNMWLWNNGPWPWEVM